MKHTDQCFLCVFCDDWWCPPMSPRLLSSAGVEPGVLPNLWAAVPEVSTVLNTHTHTPAQFPAVYAQLQCKVNTHADSLSWPLGPQPGHMTPGLDAVTFHEGGLDKIPFDHHTIDYSSIPVQLMPEVWSGLGFAPVVAAIVTCFRRESGSRALHECFRTGVSHQRARRTADAIPSSSPSRGFTFIQEQQVGALGSTFCGSVRRFWSLWLLCVCFVAPVCPSS